MKKNHIKVLLAAAVSVSTLLSAGGKVVVPADTVVADVPQEASGLYLFASGGYGSFDVTSSLVSITTDELHKDATDDNGLVFEVGVGYRITPSWSAEMAYQRSTLEIAHLDTFYTDINYNVMPDNPWMPYIGLIVGYTQLTWDEEPYVATVNKDLSSTGLAYGLQIGLEMPVTETISLLAKYQYMKHDQQIEILRENSIDHEEQHNIMMGVNYAF